MAAMDRQFWGTKLDQGAILGSRCLGHYSLTFEATMELLLWKVLSVVEREHTFAIETREIQELQSMQAALFEVLGAFVGEAFFVLVVDY